MLGRILTIVGAGVSAVLTLVAMIVTLVDADRRGVIGGTLEQILFVFGSVILVALAAVAILMTIIGAGKLSSTGLLKGIGIALAAIVFFSDWGGRFGIWWFYILLGDLLIYVGAMTMEGQLLATKPAGKAGGSHE